MIGCKLDKRYDSRVCIAAIMSEFWHSRLIYPDVAQAINFNNFDKEIHWRDYRQLIFSFIERIYYTPIVGREFQQDYINYRNAAINHIISYVWRALPVDHVKYFSSDDELVE